nr:helix-turn-helix domain-containing protein [Acetatifactor sp.]
MREIFIGELIRKKRKELKLSQADLSFGICDISTLSRIENKHQTPTRNVLNALLERLGVSDERFYAAVTAEEMRINQLYTEITNDNVEYRKAIGEEKEKIKQNLLRKHDELRQIIDEDDNISKQMLVRSQ